MGLHYIDYSIDVFTFGRIIIKIEDAESTYYIKNIYSFLVILSNLTGTLNQCSIGSLL